MGIYEHSCDAVGKRDNERDLGCNDTPEVSFYAGITHFPVFPRKVTNQTFGVLDICIIGG